MDIDIEDLLTPFVNKDGLLELNLFGEKLSDEDIPQILELLPPEVEVLYLGTLGFDIRNGVTALSHMFKTNTTLTTLNLEGTRCN